MSDDEVTQDRLRIGRWLPPFDREAHRGPALPPTTALTGEIVDAVPRSAPPGTPHPHRAVRGRTGRRAVLAGLGALVLFALLTLIPISRHGAPPTRADEAPRVTAVPS